jgi:hypothetical protein
MNNLIESTGTNACGLTNGVNGNIIGQDPKLGALADNGGSTQTFALLPGSPAIDKGDDATCAASPVNNLDQRGETRPKGPHCDIGAFESNLPTTNTVQRQGVPANPNEGGGGLACSSVTAHSAGTETFGPFNTDLTGSFTLVDLPVGTYTLRAVYPGYLATEKAGISMAELDLGTVTLRGGDVNGDNAINILDIGTIISKFGQSGVAIRSAIACSAPDEPVDINDDGNVNISDLAITAGNWGSVGPTLWQ